MRRSLALIVTVALAATLAGCSGSDPRAYEIVSRAFNTPWQQVQIEIGLTATSGATTVTIDKEAIRLVIDGQAGKFLVDVSIPASALGASPSVMRQLGLQGDSLDFDAVYDGYAFYAKSALLGTALRAMFARGIAPAGDLDGWVRLATRSELESLGAGATGDGGSFDAEPVPTRADELKRQLEDIGISLAYAGSEQRESVPVDHVTGKLDFLKFLDSPAADSVTRAQIEQMREIADDLTIGLDIFTDTASGRFGHLDFRVEVAGSSSGRVDVGVDFAEPDPGTSFAAPPNAVKIPLQDLFGAFMDTIGRMVQSS